MPLLRSWGIYPIAWLQIDRPSGAVPPTCSRLTQWQCPCGLGRGLPRPREFPGFQWNRGGAKSTVILDEDRTVESRHLVDRFVNTETFRVVGEVHGLTELAWGSLSLLTSAPAEKRVSQRPAGGRSAKLLLSAWWNFPLARASSPAYPPRMDPLLKLLQDNAAFQPAQLAAMLGTSEAEVTAKIKAYEESDVILGYRAVLNEEKLGRDMVRAVIEVKITPERGGGFDRLAERIAKYAEVHSCHLMSGSYDLIVVVEGANLREVATFVSEKLATIQGVISTATHFMLKAYKEQGILVKREHNEERLAVSP